MLCPPAFDLANHFSEWGGFECDYNMLPTRDTRRAFIEEYLESFAMHKCAGPSSETQIEKLCDEVDEYRGLPGFFWGIHALIQASISEDEFDWKGYAEIRLKEFWDWRAEEDGSRIVKGLAMPLRERRWAEGLSEEDSEGDSEEDNYEHSDEDSEEDSEEDRDEEGKSEWNRDYDLSDLAKGFTVLNDPGLYVFNRLS